MVEQNYIDDQLRKIGFTVKRFNRAEVFELKNIIYSGEQIYECVNGFYEGGVALLVATDSRVLLVDKKPMGFLNIDDLRFDMICDIDYSHRMLGAQIKISTGANNLVFKSYNQAKLRKLIGHVQLRMSELKQQQNEHASDQKKHLEEINRQLQMYLLAQHQHLQMQLGPNQEVYAPKPDPQLSDYLFAQRLMEDFQTKKPDLSPKTKTEDIKPAITTETNNQQLIDEMTTEARKEVLSSPSPTTKSRRNNVDTLALKIACAKLPELLKARRYSGSFSKSLQFKR